MNKQQLAIQELTGTWLIDEVAGHLAFRALMEQGVPDTAIESDARLELLGIDFQAHLVVPGEAAPTAGLLIIRHEGMLNTWDARRIEQALEYGRREKSVLGAVLTLNGPGGPEHAAWRVYDALRAFGKPTTAYCDHGLLGSSLYLVACGADSIVCSRVTDEVGSIGAYTTFRDVEAQMRSYGMPTKGVYAPQSSEKNAEYRAAQKGDFKPIETKMAGVAERFISLVQERRPRVGTAGGIDPMKGALVTADLALEMGLIDGITNLTETIGVTIAYCYDYYSSNYNETMFGNYVKMAALMAVKGVQPEQITEEQVTAINAELNALNGH
jgi:protease IV